MIFNVIFVQDVNLEHLYSHKLPILQQIRRALLQLLFPGKPFHWARHIAIAVCLLFAVNLLVILVPNIRDIFGITGEL